MLADFFRWFTNYSKRKLSNVDRPNEGLSILEERTYRKLKIPWGGSEPTPADTEHQPLCADEPESNLGQVVPIAQGQSRM